MNWAVGDVFLIFGETPRSDGGNIYGIYTSELSAEEEKKLLEERRPFEEYHIEEFGLWE